MSRTRRIVMRGGKPPHLALSPGASLNFSRAGVFTSNAGNLAFATAVYRQIRTEHTEVSVDGMYLDSVVSKNAAARLNAEADVVVLPLADAFRRSFVGQLKRLSRIIEKLTIPVIVIGVGGRAKLTEGSTLDAVETVNKAATRFVRAVLDHSESIGVRGHYTAEYLESLGFSSDRIDVIGCPSMFDLDHPRSIEKPASLDPNDPMILTLSPYIPRIEEFLQHNMSRYPNMVFMPQRREDLRLLLWGEPVKGYRSGLPSDVNDPLYRSGRMAMGVDVSTWANFAGQHKFAVGTRVHGSMVALHGGTPAFLLAHDTRTLELAEYHQIPHMQITEGGPLDALELFEQADYTNYNAVADERWRTYAAFLERNGLDHTMGDNPNVAYDEKLARTKYPAIVRPKRFKGEDLQIEPTKHRVAEWEAGLKFRLAKRRGDVW